MHAEAVIRLLTELSRKPIAILPEWLAALSGAVRHYAATGRWELELKQAKRVSPEGAKAAGGGVVAVVPMVGVVSHRGDIFEEIFGGGSVSTQHLLGLVRQLVADESVRAIVLDVDSPGGSIGGLEELSDEIYRARGSKRIVAVSNTLMASAAYWIASAADEVVVTPESDTGSIGVWTAHVDASKMLEDLGWKVTLIRAGKFKAEATPYESLSAEAREFIQSQVDEYYGMFVKAVARNRADTPSAVREGYGQGRVLSAREAVKAKLADRVGSLNQVVSALQARYAKRKPSRAELARAELGA
jgi:capsid assembly protease